MDCPNCGKQNSGDSPLCSSCGWVLCWEPATPKADRRRARRLLTPVLISVVVLLIILVLITTAKRGSRVEYIDISENPKTMQLPIDGQTAIDLIYIEPGSFVMGRDPGLGERYIARKLPLDIKYPDEWPERKVTITKGFYIGKYEVTSAQFCKFLNAVPNSRDCVALNKYARIEIKEGAYVPKPGCENCAINVVPWKGAVAFCKWLSCKTGLTIRLPTEAEWEFTARGSEGRTCPWGETYVEWTDEWPRVEGDKKKEKYPYPWSCAPVDAFPGNVTPDGVVGMASWVGEWCSDFYGVRYLKGDVIDPQGPTEEALSDKSLNPFDEKYHALRRGAYTTSRDFAIEVDESAGIYGFRIVVEPPVDKEGLKQCSQE